MSEMNLNSENDKLNKYFRGHPVEIRGWDRIVLVASNIENEGIEYVMGEMYSPELYNLMVGSDKYLLNMNDQPNWIEKC